jgi:hypothetical protein
MDEKTREILKTGIPRICKHNSHDVLTLLETKYNELFRNQPDKVARVCEQLLVSVLYLLLNQIHDSTDAWGEIQRFHTVYASISNILVVISDALDTMEKNID